MTWLDKDEPAFLTRLLSEVERMARNAAFTLGEEVEAFEDEFAAYCGTPHAVGVASGTDALVLALRALGIGAGDEVIVPANSFFATAEAVSLAGATPRFVDVDAVTHLVDADAVAAAVTDRTAAVIPVHLYGRTVDLEPILDLARRHGLAVIEDACQAHGATYRGKRVGSIGVCGAFSFYPAKNLGAWGDGGAFVTSDPELAARVRLLRAHGEQPRYHHRVVGSTARLDAIQAAVLRVKLRRLDSWNDARRRFALALTRALAGSGVELPARLSPGDDHVFHQYVVRSPQRDALREHLRERGIASAIHYPVPLHRTEAYAALGYASQSLPVSEQLAERILSLPMLPVMSDLERAQLVGRIAAAVHTLNADVTD